MAGGATFAPKIGAKTIFLELEIMIFGFFMKFQIDLWYSIYDMNLTEARGFKNENLVEKGF